MKSSEMNSYKQGILYTVGSYLIWGILPLYWKMIENVSAEEILAHRIFWSCLFMLVLLSFNREWNHVLIISKQMIKSPRLILSLIFSSFLISTNWFVYIWAVNNGHIIEASLGYYINPLLSVLLGVIFLKEKLNRLQKISFVIALLGVTVMALHYGHIPLVAITLALSFGLYSLTKKLTKFSATIGLTFETLVVTPIAIYYLMEIASRGESQFFAFHLPTNLLLIGTGIATAIPLLLFASGAQLIPLMMVGLLQYLTPTITLIIGIVLFKEPFTTIELITFSFIWGAIVLFTLSNVKNVRKIEITRTKKNSVEL
jgi:chloramphenicol-sensitive protein RarD